MSIEANKAIVRRHLIDVRIVAGKLVSSTTANAWGSVFNKTSV